MTGSYQADSTQGKEKQTISEGKKDFRHHISLILNEI